MTSSKPISKEELKEKLAKMREQDAKMEKWTNSNFGLRTFIALLVGSPICAGLFGLFREMAKTEGWVREYQNWIVAGVWIIGAAIWAVIVFWPSPRKEDQR